MAKSSRDKGGRGEREVCAVFRAHGFDVDRVPNSGGLRLKGDVYGETLPLHVEAKRQEVVRIREWIAQAESECGERIPVVAFRWNRGAWYAALPLDDLVRLLRQAEALSGVLAR